MSFTEIYLEAIGIEVQGFGYRVQGYLEGTGMEVRGLDYRVQGYLVRMDLRFRAWIIGFRASVSGTQLLLMSSIHPTLAQPSHVLKRQSFDP